MEKKRIKDYADRLALAVRKHPTEVFLAICFGISGCLFYEYEWKGIQGLLFYAPVLFLFTYTLNSLFPEGKRRLPYYLSAGCPVAFLWVGMERPTVIWIVSVCVIQLLYLISFRQRDNDRFMERLLCYFRSGVSAGILTLIACLLVVSVFYSVQYIFEIWMYREVETRFVSYVVSFGGLSVFPLLFMLFNEDQRFGKGTRIFDVLVNYVLSPVLLIYAVILYLYVIRIALYWSLPKGGVAYIVISFVMMTFLLKGCQAFVRKRYYRWFFRWISLVVAPPLVLYWVGVGYRIHQYGFTEPRVYLVVAGLILTGAALLFLTERRGRYLYAACLAVALLSVVTYIPGMRAADIERISQANRPNNTYIYSLNLNNK